LRLLLLLWLVVILLLRLVLLALPVIWLSLLAMVLFLRRLLFLLLLLRWSLLILLLRLLLLLRRVLLTVQGSDAASVLGRAVWFPRSGSTLVHKKGVRRREPGPNEYDEDGIRPTSAGGSTFDRYSREVA
jgi:hypothetical protein